MRRLAIVIAVLMLAPSCAVVSARHANVSHRSGTTLPPAPPSLARFDSLQQLKQVMAAVESARREAEQQRLAAFDEHLALLCKEWAKSDTAVGVTCPFAGTSLSQTITVAATALSITNNQHAGVDEGDVVKREGDVLILLRRGRLFTIGIGDGQMRALDVADAFGPRLPADMDAENAWYDELLVWHRTVIVIGYSYARGGTEINLFDLGDHGKLRHRATYHLRSNDYYSSSNYASRLIGDRLVLFTSSRVPQEVDPNAWLPAMRRWDSRGSDGRFQTIAPITRVFQPVVGLSEDLTIHTLTVCRLAAPSFACEATVVLGDPLDVYYASPTAGYAWTSSGYGDGDGRAILYRIPFDGSPVAALRVSGRPSDQLAFFEDSSEYLNVVVEHRSAVRLLRVPLNTFSDGNASAPLSSYRSLMRGDAGAARFVGRYVLVGPPTAPNEQRPTRLIVTDRENGSVVVLPLSHTIERIEALGAQAVVIGTADDALYLTTIDLERGPTVAATIAFENAAQAESRSHAFSYREDGIDDGIFGVAITAPARDDVEDPPARILFVRNRGLGLISAGTLDPMPIDKHDDHCVTSCVDWYGDARAIFIDTRIFALSGYVLSEGHLEGERIQEIGGLDFTPRTSAH